MSLQYLFANDKPEYNPEDILFYPTIHSPGKQLMRGLQQGATNLPLAFVDYIENSFADAWTPLEKQLSQEAYQQSKWYVSSAKITYPISEYHARSIYAQHQKDLKDQYFFADLKARGQTGKDYMIGEGLGTLLSPVNLAIDYATLGAGGLFAESLGISRAIRVGRIAHEAIKGASVITPYTAASALHAKTFGKPIKVGEMVRDISLGALFGGVVGSFFKKPILSKMDANIAHETAVNQLLDGKKVSVETIVENGAAKRTDKLQSFQAETIHPQVMSELLDKESELINKYYKLIEKFPVEEGDKVLDFKLNYNESLRQAMRKTLSIRNAETPIDEIDPLFSKATSLFYKNMNALLEQTDVELGMLKRKTDIPLIKENLEKQLNQQDQLWVQSMPPLMPKISLSNTLERLEQDVEQVKSFQGNLSYDAQLLADNEAGNIQIQNEINDLDNVIDTNFDALDESIKAETHAHLESIEKVRQAKKTLLENYLKCELNHE